MKTALTRPRDSAKPAAGVRLASMSGDEPDRGCHLERKIHPMMSCPVRSLLFAGLCVVGLASFASAQTAPPPYGEAITLEQAKKVLAAAEAEAQKNDWPVAISIVDGSGFLVAFQRLDNTQLGSVEVSLEKAKTSALFRRPTKAFEEVLEKGGVNVRVLRLPGALPIEGGLPIIHGGKVIGAIGVSGVKSTEDAQVAAAGLEALKASAK
jgi:glc operon protein GlcG